MPSDGILKHPHALRCGARIARFRAAHGWSQRELATRAQFSNQQISKVETGELNTPIETLARIAEALGIRLEVLIEETPIPSSREPTIPSAIITQVEQLIATYGAMGVHIEQLAAFIGMAFHARIAQESPTPQQYSGLEYFKLRPIFPYALARVSA